MNTRVLIVEDEPEFLRRFTEGVMAAAILRALQARNRTEAVVRARQLATV